MSRSVARPQGITLTTTMCLIVLMGILLSPQTQATGQSLLPGFRAPLLNEPNTPSAFRDKLSQSSSTTGPSIDDAEIQELARGLKYDPGLMYKFVHDHIHFTPTWGEVKGPYMTWMDHSEFLVVVCK